MGTAIQDCSVAECSFNRDGCSASAITIGGSPEHATCTTFIALDVNGGLPVRSASVGACQRVECTHNDKLMCTANDVRIGSVADKADCLSYTAA